MLREGLARRALTREGGDFSCLGDRLFGGDLVFRG